MKYTPEQIGKVAAQSAFYVDPDGMWLRILYTSSDEGYFYAMDENDDEEYKIFFEDVAEEADPHFEKLTRVRLEQPESTTWIEP